PSCTGFRRNRSSKTCCSPAPRSNAWWNRLRWQSWRCGCADPAPRRSAAPPSRWTGAGRRTDSGCADIRPPATTRQKGWPMSTEPVSIPTKRAPMKVVFASLVGTTIEWYDFFLYGSAAALVFNKLFFPAGDPLTGTLLAFITYAVGFVARPLGGLVFGHYGDRLGRKKLLVLSLVMMGGSTFVIGLLPTYQAIGVAAPLLLTALRLVQGFAIGGEWGGAVLMVSEHGSAEHRGFWSSWPQGGVPMGNLLGTAVLAVLAAVQSEEAFLQWGWRIGFLLSG